jgi:hypothetical protein
MSTQEQTEFSVDECQRFEFSSSTIQMDPSTLENVDHMLLSLQVRKKLLQHLKSISRLMFDVIQHKFDFQTLKC